jgi:hypothetical protein
VRDRECTSCYTTRRLAREAAEAAERRSTPDRLALQLVRDGLASPMIISSARARGTIAAELAETS